MSTEQITRKFAIGDAVIPDDYPLKSTVTGFEDRDYYRGIDAPGPLYVLDEGNEGCPGVHAESELRPWIDPDAQLPRKTIFQRSITAVRAQLAQKPPRR